jgi:hypothetical protein
MYIIAGRLRPYRTWKKPTPDRRHCPFRPHVAVAGGANEQQTNILKSSDSAFPVGCPLSTMPGAVIARHGAIVTALFAASAK